MKSRHNEKVGGTRGVVSDVAISKRGRGGFIFLPYVITITKNQELSIIYSIKTNSTALSYLSIFTNKTVEIIAMKILRFVEVATQSHRLKETGGFLKVLRGDRGHLPEQSRV